MKYIIENEKIKAEIDSFGAELKSVKSKIDDREYMWNADKKYWARTSPVLFPFVGGLKNKEFIVDGKHYPMGQHGFARDTEFELLSQDDKAIFFVLKSNESTLDKYPFDFILKIGYELIGNAVKVIWEVENPADSVLPFSIGAHPAFFCPVDGDNDKTGYKLSFGRFKEDLGNTLLNTVIDVDAECEPVTEIHHHGNSSETGLALTEDIVLPTIDGRVEITDGFFDRCTYMIEGNQANSVGIVDKNGKEYVTMIFDTPLFAIWSPEGKNAPFVCIEPWYGRCDHEDFEGELDKREYTNFVKSGECFHAEYVMVYK